jgi:ketosteroid isomerase-like protein
MSIKNALASVPVRDLGCAGQWYQKLIGRPPDSRPTSEVVAWNFEGGGSLQVYQNAERAGAGSFSFVVGSVDDQVSALRQFGLDARSQMIGGEVRVVMVKDPDGNSIAFAEAIDPAPETGTSEIVRAYFSAYETKDRAALESLLHENFTFSSPHDPDLDRQSYFERCWPNSVNTSAFEIQHLVEREGHAFVLYECTPKVGAAFSNAEYFRVVEGKVTKVQVFYGSLPNET